MDRGQSLESATPRLVLVTPVIDDAAAFAPLLAAACKAADVAAVILRLAPADEDELVNRIRVLAPEPHRVEAALLLDGRANLVESTDADGVLVAGAEAVVTARSALKGDRIVGAGRLESRHDAMTAGDNGADFVLFGEPDEHGKRPAAPALIERVTWWAELFVLPCVAYAARIEEIEPFVGAGADFIGLGSEVVWDSADGPAAALAAAASRLALMEAAQ
jgi:thiamine-phosphate pyrophosphorylase